MESQKNKLIITSHFMHGTDAGVSRTKQEFMHPAFLTDSLKTTDTVKLKKDWFGLKLSAKRWMS